MLIAEVMNFTQGYAGRPMRGLTLLFVVFDDALVAWALALFLLSLWVPNVLMALLQERYSESRLGRWVRGGRNSLTPLPPHGRMQA